MKRYHFLTDKDVYDALNRLTDVFLAAKDGNEVREIINGLLTEDEKIKIGRRVIVAELVKSDMKVRDVVQIGRIGGSTVSFVRRMEQAHPKCYELINARHTKMEKEYAAKKYSKSGGSKLVFKKKEYTGIKRSDIKR